MSRTLTLRRFAGSLMLDLTCFEDLKAAIEIPEALWVAIACPTSGMKCDPRFLELLDADGNKRIRVKEVKEAVAFVQKHFHTFAGCDAGSDVLMLSHLTREADVLRQAAVLLLDLLASEEDEVHERLSLAQLRAGLERLSAAEHFGEGLLTQQAVASELKEVHLQLTQLFPDTFNRHGKPAISRALLSRARSQLQLARAHQRLRSEAMLWGEQSLPFAKRLLQVQSPLNAYFLLCRLVESQPELQEALRLKTEQVNPLLGDLEALTKATAALPVALPQRDGVLRFDTLSGSPSREALESLRADVLIPLLGQAEQLDELRWRTLERQALQVVAWQETWDQLPVVLRAPELLTVSDETLLKLEAACEADLAQKKLLDRLVDLERLVLYQRWLLEFCNNFISMPALYDPHRGSLFDWGRLILAGREFHLSVIVPEHAAHVKQASSTPLCLAYVRVSTHRAEDAPFEVAVPVTAGNSSGIQVGRRGVFLQHDGKEYDAEVIEVVAHPVSLWEATFQPFSRIGQFITSKFESLSNAGLGTLDTSLNKGMDVFSSTAHKAVLTGATSAAATTAATAATSAAATTAATSAAAATTAAAAGSTNMLTLLAGGGLAIAALGSSLAFILAQLRQLTLVDVVSTLLMLFTLVALPSGLVGWLKLRRRNLAVVLEGSGWALNDRLLVTSQAGPLFTRRPSMPSNTRMLPLDEVKELIRLGRLTGYEADETGLRWWQVLLGVLMMIAYIAWYHRAIWLSWIQWVTPSP